SRSAELVTEPTAVRVVDDAPSTVRRTEEAVLSQAMWCQLPSSTAGPLCRVAVPPVPLKTQATWPPGMSSTLNCSCGATPLRNRSQSGAAGDLVVRMLKEMCTSCEPGSRSALFGMVTFDDDPLKW